MSSKQWIEDGALCKRLRELSKAVTQGREAVAREFTMRVPAEHERDADLVLSEAASRIKHLRAENTRLREIAECNDPGVVGLRAGQEIGDE